MAFVEEQNNDQSQQQQQPATGNNSSVSQLPQTSSGTGGGASSGNTSAAGSPQGAPSIPNASKAPPVQNLSEYLNANQPQALQMGQNIAQNITNQGQQVTGDINADQAAFDQSVQASNVAPNSDLVGRAASDPTAFVQNPNDLQAFQAQRDASYTGPDSFEGSDYYQPLTQKVQSFQSNSPDTTTQNGILRLVSGQEKNPTLGMQNLDALLLGGTPGATDAIRAAQAPYANLGQTLTNVGNTENANIAMAKANTVAAPQAVRDAFLTGNKAVVPAYQQALNDKLAQSQQGATNYNNQIGQNIQKLNPLESQLGKWQGATGLKIDDPLQKYLNQTPLTNAPTQANTASAEDYAKNAALEQLLGTGYSPVLSDANASQAGSFNVPETLTPDLSALAYEIAGKATPVQLGAIPRAPIAGPGVFQQGFSPEGNTNQSLALAGALGPTSPYETLLAYLNSLNSNDITKGSYNGINIPGEYLVR